MAKASGARAQEASSSKSAAMAFAGAGDGAKGGPMSLYFVPASQKALTLAARFYIYGKGHISKSTFDDPEFRALLRGYYVAGGGMGASVTPCAHRCRVRTSPSHASVCVWWGERCGLLFCTCVVCL